MGHLYPCLTLISAFHYLTPTTHYALKLLHLSPHCRKPRPLQMTFPAIPMHPTTAPPVAFLATTACCLDVSHGLAPRQRQRSAPALPSTAKCEGTQQISKSAPTLSRSHKIYSHRSRCPTSPLAVQHLTDHSTMPLYTYNESITTTNFSPANLCSTACNTPRNSPRLTHARSDSGTHAARLRSGCSPKKNPYPAYIHPRTRFADPSVYAST